MWNAMPSCSAAARSPGPTSAADYRDARAEVMGRGERLGHGRREVVAERPVPVLQHGHRPGQVPQVEHVDVVGQGDELRPEALLELVGQASDRGRQLAGHPWIGEGAAEPEQPQASGGECRGDDHRGHAGAGP